MRRENARQRITASETAVELRRRIGSKEISPVELLEACIARIERLNPAVNAVTATCYERARAGSRRRGEGGAARGAARPAARPAGRHKGSRRDRRPADDLRLAVLPRLRSRARQRDGGARARGGRRRRRQDQRAGVRRRRQFPQCRVGRDRQSLRSRRSIPAARRAGRPWRSQRECCPCARARTPAGRSASRRRNAASSASAPRPVSCRWSGARSAGRRSRWSGRWAARSRTPACCSRRRRRWTTAIRSPIRSMGARSRRPSRATRARCASRIPRISACARSTPRYARCSATGSRPCGTVSGPATRSLSISARPTAAST